MDSLADRVAATLRRRALLRPGDRVVVALSGGPDSVALTHVLAGLQAACSVTLVGVAHFNHALRPEADADEEFCRSLARELAVPCVVEVGDVRGAAERARRSVEDAARELRYSFLERARLELGANRIAVAHTLNDQAETVLLRLVRRSGPLGLAAIWPARGAVVRPLIDCTRGEVERYLERAGKAYRHDASNDDLSHPRNRIRHELLPYLRRDFSPRILQGLAQLADEVRELGTFVDEVATKRARAIVLEGDGRAEVELEALAGEPRALRRLLLLRALRHVSGGRFIGSAHVNRVESMSRGDGPWRVDMPGHRVRKEGSRLLLEARRDEPVRRRGRVRLGPLDSSTRSESSQVPDSRGQRVMLPVPGEALCQGGWHVWSELMHHDRLDNSDQRGLFDGIEFATQIACEGVGALFVRGRQPGDRLEPVGLGGRKKVQDVFVDRKVARDQRDSWPIIVDDQDRIVWVVGLAQSAHFQVRGVERGVIFLKAKRLGG